MDALPIAETSGKPWASKVFGKMHACGHDGHTAMLLAAARHLAATRNFDGILHLVFQPAEEGLAGARKMLEDGFLELFPCDAMFGMHNMPGLPEPASSSAVPGFAMASGDTCIITVRGKGGHGAMPQARWTRWWPARSIVMALQTIVSRNVPPLQMGIVTVGAFLAGDAPNVIPGTAELRLTVRACSPDVRDLLERRITEIAQAQAASLRRHGRGELQRRYPVLHNDPRRPRSASRWCATGWATMRPGGQPRAGDRQRGLRLLPGEGAGLLRLHRQRRGQRGGCMVHNPGYDFNDRVLSTGASYWVRLPPSPTAAAHRSPPASSCRWSIRFSVTLNTELMIVAPPGEP
jgi:hippurate hydrolase